MIEDIKINIEKAQNFLKRKDFANAETLLLKNLEITKDNFETFFLLGTIYGIKKDFDKAVSYLEKAINIKPEHINSILNLAIIFKKIDQNEKSMNCFEKVINLDKKNIESYCGIAEIFEKKGNLREAEIFYQKAIKIDNLHHIANHRYGKLLFRLNQHLKGLKLIEKVSGMIRFKNETIEIK